MDRKFDENPMYLPIYNTPRHHCCISIYSEPPSKRKKRRMKTAREYLRRLFGFGTLAFDLITLMHVYLRVFVPCGECVLWKLNGCRFCMSVISHLHLGVGFSIVNHCPGRKDRINEYVRVFVNAKVASNVIFSNIPPHLLTTWVKLRKVGSFQIYRSGQIWFFLSSVYFFQLVSWTSHSFKQTENICFRDGQL